MLEDRLRVEPDVCSGLAGSGQLLANEHVAVEDAGHPN